MKIDDFIKCTSVSNLKELGDLDSLIAFLQNEVTPLKLNVSTYDELLDTINILKLHWDSFKTNDYFINEESKFIYALVFLDSVAREELLGITRDLYHDKNKARAWRDKIAKLIHPDKCNIINANKAMSKLNDLYSRMVEDE